ncbi:MAG: NADH-quinone oxidoreductase subunit M [Bacteroidetes bacterium]|nr:NADH-quinone oxidoreductase subunit M [Bacteroidota bacterium]
MLTGILILFPLLGSLVLLFGRDSGKIRRLALGISLVEFGLALYGLYLFVTTCHCQLQMEINWANSLGVTLRFGMDGISLLLVLLTTFLIPLIILSSFRHEYRNPYAFYALILLMETAFIGVFCAMNGIVFYVFWELALIPAWFICAVWGGNDRIRITFKFFIYTFVGSLAMLGALVYLYYRTPMPHSFDIRFLYGAILSYKEQVWIFWAFFLAFAIKIPVFPFHTWQPDTYTESPAGGTMLLSGIMLKMGIYGLIRFLLPICYGVLKDWGMVAMIMAVAGIIYASVIALRQNDMKRLVAWSSIAHVGLITAGIFTLTIKAMEGAVIQMISHGINIVGLFIILDIIERRMKTRKISELGGIANGAPWLAVSFMIILLGVVALPSTNGFIGEFLLLFGLFEYNYIIAGIAGLTIIFTAIYMLRMFQRAMLGEKNELTAAFTDLTMAETITLVPVIIMILWIGLFPGFFLQLAEPAIKDILMFTR